MSGRIESEPQTPAELPASLTWSNTLVRLGGVSLMRAVRGEFATLIRERPEDLDLRDRVRGYIAHARDELEIAGSHDQLLSELGDPTDY